jgi:uncharacterized protein YeeX (DUF496 family)
MLFKKKTIDPQELDYESKLAYDILGESDYTTFNKLLAHLGYSSPGVYLSESEIQQEDLVKCPAKLAGTNFERRFQKFVNNLSNTPSFWSLLIGIPTREYFDFHFNRINDILHFELMNREFANPDKSIDELKLRVLELRNLSVYINKEGGDISHRLSHMEMLLEKRISNHLIESEQEDYLSNGKVNPKYQFDLCSSIRKFKKFVILLEQKGLIDESEKFISLFISPEKRLDEKILWDGYNISLLFLIEYLSHQMKIIKPKNYLMSISMSFKTSESGQLLNTNLASQLNNVGFRNFNDKDFESFFTRSSNEEIKIINTVYSRVYSS